MSDSHPTDSTLLLGYACGVLDLPSKEVVVLRDSLFARNRDQGEPWPVPQELLPSAKDLVARGYLSSSETPPGTFAVQLTDYNWTIIAADAARRLVEQGREQELPLASGL